MYLVRQSDNNPAPVANISSVSKAAQVGSPENIYRGRSLQGLSGPSSQKCPDHQLPPLFSRLLVEFSKSLKPN